MAAPLSSSQVNLVSPFLGEKSDDVESWIMKFESMKEACGWDNGRAIAIAESKLEGKAALWLRGQKAIGTIWTTWNELKKEIQGRFKLEVTEIAATLAIHDLKQTKNESVDEFFDRVLIALDQKNHRVTNEMKATDEWKNVLKTDIFTFFGAGLKKYIRDATVSSSSPPLNATDLLKAARFVETSSRATDLSMMDQAEVEATRYVDRRQETGRRSFNHEDSGLLCWRCDKPGHFRRNCRVNLGTQGRGRGFGSPRGINTAPVDWEEVRKETKEKEPTTPTDEMVSMDYGRVLKQQSGNE